MTRVADHTCPDPAYMSARSTLNKHPGWYAQVRSPGQSYAVNATNLAPASLTTRADLPTKTHHAIHTHTFRVAYAVPGARAPPTRTHPTHKTIE